ncbi:MAG: hypothetical protein V3S46_05600 [Nitrospinota bacterium]
MCNNLDRSAMMMFQVFGSGPIKKEDLYKKIYEHPMLRFSLSNSLNDFIQALIFDGDIELDEGGYKITDKGKEELKSLEEKCST